MKLFRTWYIERQLVFFCAVLILSVVLLSANAEPAARSVEPAATISIDASQRLGRIEPLLYGQFIEHLGHCINGGIFDPGSTLSNTNGFRRDVLEKGRELAPKLLRWPGGTFSKIYHWQDGVGPKAERRRRPNLIWGGEEDNLFGTDEFIQYCRLIGAEPYISVNMGTGTAEEAANWVEYCNGTGNTYYANLRRQNGFEEPHCVKFWGLGNEEDAEPDCGHLQNPTNYAAEAWQFVKLMKLHDPTIKLVVAGVGNNTEWNTVVLQSLHPVADYLSVHFYLPSKDYADLLNGIARFDKQLLQLGAFLSAFPEKPVGFGEWYRFPPRQGPVRLALDEWGIWNGGKGREDLWGLEATYNWQDALGVASWLNVMHRHAGWIGFANWAQMVNVIAPIRADGNGSVRQTVFHALAMYARYCGRWSVASQCESPLMDEKAGKSLPALDISASTSEQGNTLTLAVVNRHPARAIEARIKITGGTFSILKDGYELTAPSMTAQNVLAAPDADCVQCRRITDRSEWSVRNFPARSITLLIIE